MGLSGSIFDLVAGNPAQTEQDKFGALGDYETGVGEGLTTAGAGVEEDILSGDPTKIAQVEAPEITAQNKQIEQQRLQDANFGTRSGGTTASTENAEAAGRANIIDLTGSLVGNTAGAAVGQGSGLLGQASSNVGNEANLAEQRRQQELGDASGIESAVASIATGFPAEGESGADPYETLYNAQHGPPIPTQDADFTEMIQ